MKTVKVTNTPFVRDINSMGLSNNNTSERNEYYSKVRMLKTQKDEINTMKSEISEIKNDISELKSMMVQLLSKGSNV